MAEIRLNSHVNDIVMPENLRVGLMIKKQREVCRKIGCSFDYYALAFGQSPFHVLPSLQKALSENTDKGHYSESEGIPELRYAISEFNFRHFGLRVDPARIIVGPGTKDLIHTIFRILDVGVIIPSPSWIGYNPQVDLLEKHFHTFYLKPEFDYKIQPDDLDEFISNLSDSQHILVLNNPHNPTGLVYSKNELEEITKICRKHNTLVLSDEIYALTTYNMKEFTSMGLIYPEGTFVTNGLSKDRSAGGYRLGSCILPEKCSQNLIENFKKVAATVYTYVSTPIQHASIIAYESKPEINEYFEITRQIHRIMGQYLSSEFNKISEIKATIPQGGFYFFVDFNEMSSDLKRKGVMTSNQLGSSLISCPHHIATVTGDACLLKEEDYGARVAFVDYKGKQTFDSYKNNPPTTFSDEVEFVKQNAPLMVQSIDAIKQWIAFIKQR